MKLLYLVERESVIRWGRPFTFDRPISMDQGTVLSSTLNLIKEDTPANEHTYWKTHISPPCGDHEIALLKEPEYDELSPKDCELIEEIFAKFGRLDRWALRNLTHTLPEWHDPHGSSLEIDYREILMSAKKSPDEIGQILSEIEGIALVDKLFS